MKRSGMALVLAAFALGCSGSSGTNDDAAADLPDSGLDARDTPPDVSAQDVPAPDDAGDADDRADAIPDPGSPDLPALDDGVPDLPLPDVGPPDEGPPDEGPADPGAPDEGPVDPGPPDEGPADPGAPDMGPVSPYGPAGTPLPTVGFGAATVGGLQDGHDTYVVTSLDDDGPGTLREGLRTGNQPRLLLFAVDGAITSLSPQIVPSNITIDGRGHDITLKGMGVVIPGSDQVVLTNLAFEDIGPETQDGLQIGSALPDPSEFVVLDHLRFTQHGDGGNCENVDEAISIVFGSRNITVAWCRFENWEKVLLAGNGDADPALDGQITLTWHHSYAQATGRRHPQARHGRYHLFNNFWDDWRMYGWEWLPPYHESFGSQVQDNGRMLLQGQMVRRNPHDYELASTANDASRCESGGDLLESGTWTDPASTAPLKFRVGCAGKEAFEPPYAVEVEEAGPALRDRVVAGAGNTL